MTPLDDLAGVRRQIEALARMRMIAIRAGMPDLAATLFARTRDLWRVETALLDEVR